MNTQPVQHSARPKPAPMPSKIVIDMTWDAAESGNKADFIDLSAILLEYNDRPQDHRDIVYYNNLVSRCNGVHYESRFDNAGLCYSKRLNFDFNAISDRIQKIVVIASHHQHQGISGTLGSIPALNVTLVAGAPMIRALEFQPLPGESEYQATAITFAELHREGAGWRFDPIGQAIDGGLHEIVERYFQAAQV